VCDDEEDLMRSHTSYRTGHLRGPPVFSMLPHWSSRPTIVPTVDTAARSLLESSSLLHA
jgi:hypothetical protein